jgi:hypothetical protein
MPPALKKTVQVRFVEAKLPRDADPSRLRRPSGLIKYIALYQNMGTTCVLAQGESKFTLKKWKEILSASTVQAVDDMCASVAAAQQLEGFEEHGTYSKQRLAAAAAGPKKGKTMVVEEPPSQTTEQPREDKPAQEPINIIKPVPAEAPKPPLPKPDLTTARDGARKAYLDALKSMEERERRMPPFIPSDFEVDIDDMPTTIPRRSAKELLRRGREGARKAALDYIDVLRRAGRLHPNTIPPCLREAAAARLAEQEGARRMAGVVVDKQGSA